MSQMNDLSIPRAVINKLKSKISFFANFVDEEMLELLRMSIRKEYASDEVIFLENAEGDEMYVILSGDVKITKKTPDESEIVLASLSVGDCFGEMSMIDGSNRSAMAKAEGEVVLLALQEAVLKKNLNLAYKLFKNFSVLMAERLRVTSKSFTDISADEAKSRIKFSDIIKRYSERGGSFEESNLSASTLSRILFTQNNMKSTLFVKSALKDSRFNKSNFDLSSFVGANFKNAIFSDCNFKGANFAATSFERVIFKNCNFDEAVIRQMEAIGVVFNNQSVEK